MSAPKPLAGAVWTAEAVGWAHPVQHPGLAWYLPAVLRIGDITYRVGGRTLFEGASAHVPAGHRVGLVGPNGSGKTTLVRLILGEIEPSSGEISIRRRASIGAIAQEAPGGEATPLEHVLAADRERSELLAEAEVAGEAERIAEVHARLVDIDAHAAPSRAAAILAGLGVGEGMMARPLSALSGGWRMRVALAAALFREPDLLLLDEPTNHLDLESAEWLGSYLSGYPRTLVVVSHDREILNRVAGRVLHIEERRLAAYAGGYDAFERTRRERLARAEVERERREEERRRMEAFVARARADKATAGQAQSRIKALERMAPVRAVARERRGEITFPEPAAVASPAIELDGAEAGYAPGRAVLSDLSLAVHARDRIALVGENGNGKTTLTRLLAGDLEPLSGEVRRAPRLAVGYFAQDRLERLRSDRTALEEMAAAAPDDPPERVRARLGGIGLSRERAEVPVAGLSGGERTRLALAIAAAKRPNLLVLDEPTNHLDAESRGALVRGLKEFGGAVVLVSHDRHIVEATCDQLWLVRGGTARPYLGDVGQYCRAMLEERSASRPVRSRDRAGRPSRKDERRSAAEARERIAPARRAAAEAEDRIERLTLERDGVEAELADPSVYGGPEERLADLARRRQDLDREIAAAEERWLGAAELLDELLAREEMDR